MLSAIKTEHSLFPTFIGCRKDTPITVKLVEVTHTVFYAPQYVAIKKRFFEEVDKIIELNHLPCVNLYLSTTKSSVRLA